MSNDKRYFEPITLINSKQRKVLAFSHGLCRETSSYPYFIIEIPCSTFDIRNSKLHHRRIRGFTENAIPKKRLMILLARGGMAEKPFNKHRAEAPPG